MALIDAETQQATGQDTSEFLTGMSIATPPEVPGEIEMANRRYRVSPCGQVQVLKRRGDAPLLSVFGSKSRGSRWPVSNFLNPFRRYCKAIGAAGRNEPGTPLVEGVWDD